LATVREIDSNVAVRHGQGLLGERHFINVTPPIAIPDPE
jgi:hypothetical protein